MSIDLVLYTDAHRGAVERFNQRYKAVEPDPLFLIADRPPDDNLDPPGAPVEWRHYVLTDGAEVRGGLIVQRQDFLVNGRILRVGNAQSPLAEGIFDKKFAQTGTVLVKKMMKLDPLMYTVGMGGLDRPFPRMLKALKWRLDIAPFFFRVVRTTRFLTQMQMLRSSGARRLLSSAAAYTGAGWAGIKAAQTLRKRARTSGVSAEIVSTWGPWADEVWQEASQTAGYVFAAVRTAEVLRSFNPLEPGSRISACRVKAGGQVVGWAALMTRDMRGHRLFGDLRLGTVLDVMARPGFEETVAAAASNVFESGVDLLVTNQWQPFWRRAFERSGYFKGPSKFGIGFSPELLAAIGDDWSRMHITRADGDGRSNL